MLIDKLFSSLSLKMNYEGLGTKTTSSGWGSSKTTFQSWPASNYVLTSSPTSYITIDYHKGENGPVTGSLKIVVLNEKLNTDDPSKGLFPDNGGFVP